MEYDKALLKTWAEMETWDEYLEKNNAFAKNVSAEGFKFLEQKYFKEVKRRINHCKKLLTEHDDACIYYTLAELHNRCNLDESPEYLYKRPVRYYCIKAIKKNRYHAPVWALLAEAYAWVVRLGGESDTMPTFEAMVEEDITFDIRQKDPIAQQRILWFVNRAIRCAKKAFDFEPENKKYQRLSKECYKLKAEVLCAEENRELGPFLKEPPFRR